MSVAGSDSANDAIMGLTLAKEGDGGRRLLESKASVDGVELGSLLEPTALRGQCQGRDTATEGERGRVQILRGRIRLVQLRRVRVLVIPIVHMLLRKRRASPTPSER